jgi:two-component system, chemotaxis family, chemotaxis protein CheY
MADATAHVLIVEDDADLRELLARLLSEEGYQVRVAANGAEALRAVERTMPALILLDMTMPVLDGWGFSRALRERHHPDRPAIAPILVMTAAVDAATRAADVGACGWVAKPFDVDRLLSEVARCVASTARAG